MPATPVAASPEALYAAQIYRAFQRDHFTTYFAARPWIPPLKADPREAYLAGIFAFWDERPAHAALIFTPEVQEALQAKNIKRVRMEIRYVDPLPAKGKGK